MPAQLKPFDLRRKYLLSPRGVRRLFGERRQKRQMRTSTPRVTHDKKKSSKDEQAEQTTQNRFELKNSQNAHQLRNEIAKRVFVFEFCTPRRAESSKARGNSGISVEIWFFSSKNLLMTICLRYSSRKEINLCWLIRELFVKSDFTTFSFRYSKNSTSTPSRQAK